MTIIRVAFDIISAVITEVFKQLFLMTAGLAFIATTVILTIIILITR